MNTKEPTYWHKTVPLVLAIHCSMFHLVGHEQTDEGYQENMQQLVSTQGQMWVTSESGSKSNQTCLRVRPKENVLKINRNVNSRDK